jgi:rubrerythrin
MLSKRQSQDASRSELRFASTARISLLNETFRVFVQEEVKGQTVSWFSAANLFQEKHMNPGASKQNATATAQRTTETHGTLNQKTLYDLSTAMHGEAFAYAKYLLYAEHARKNGNKELADLFEKTANTERFEHFAEEAELAELVGSDADNLKDAIQGESYEIDSMYLEFAQKARVAGDTAAAARFEEIRQDEMGHRDAFKIALAKLES